MATKLVKPVSREITVTDEFDNSGEVIVTMKVDGVEFRKKGTQRKLFVTWKKVGKVAQIPPHAPGRHVANPFGWMTQK